VVDSALNVWHELAGEVGRRVGGCGQLTSSTLQLSISSTHAARSEAHLSIR
jgi:hypothetical protein